MRIHFNGAARTVTGSQHLLEINGSRLLLECGLFQGHRRDFYERNQNFSFEPRGVDAVILSHAHIDHSGNLPNLVKQGFSNPIYATPATAHLADIMLRDSGHIQEADIEFINKKRFRRGEPPAEPLYTMQNAAEVTQYLRPVSYDEPFEPVPGVIVRLVEAGHILGSAGVSLEIEEKGRKVHLWFSGDIGRHHMPLLREPVLPGGKVDYLMMECTYGDKPHEDFQVAYNELRDVIKRTVERGGKVIIPAFAVGRTQELVYFLNEMIAEGSIPSVPVYVDSPLAVHATEVFEQHPECFDKETHDFIRRHKHPALEFEQLTYTHSVEESKAINDRKGPLIIISASGMAETGRILHHLRNNIEDPRNVILIVSWQAPDTLGRRLAEREQKVRIFGEVFHRRAEVATIGGLSSHAGQTLLIDYAMSVKDQARQVFLVHGEERAAAALRECLGERGLKQTVYPDWHESVEI
jgi:metallo-beta-lactamase family protein